MIKPSIVPFGNNNIQVLCRPIAFARGTLSDHMSNCCNPLCFDSSNEVPILCLFALLQCKALLDEQFSLVDPGRSKRPEGAVDLIKIQLEFVKNTIQAFLACRLSRGALPFQSFLHLPAVVVDSRWITGGN